MDPVNEDVASFFELVAQDQLRELLGPVLRYVTSVFAQSYPRYLLRLLNHHDEIYALMTFFIERYYLKNWSSSFAENFYGLRRRRLLISKPVPLPRVTSRLPDNSERMSKRQIRLSLFFLVAVPYLRSKASELYENSGGGPTSDLLDDEPQEQPPSLDIINNSRMGEMKKIYLKFFKTIYAYLTAFHAISHLIFSLRYLFGKSHYWRASQALMGIEITRMTPNDHNRMQHALDSQKISPFARDSLTGRRPDWRLISRRFWRMISQKFFESLRVILPGSIFLFKFLEWWFSSSNTSRNRSSISDSKGNQFPPIQPPAALKPQITGVLGDGKALVKPILKGHCPICRTQLVNATALPSGWVFCYKCVHSYVVEFQRCPVTLFPTSLSDLRKIIGQTQ